MIDKSLDESFTASLSSRLQSEFRDRWSSGYQFLIFSLSCTLSDYTITEFNFETEAEHRGNFIQYFIGYAVVGLPIYYMQVFIGQYTQMGVVALKYICPVGHGLCYLYLVNLITSCILLSSRFVIYAIYLFTMCQKEMPWTVCPEFHQNCWTKDDRNERCPSNCLKTDANLSSYVYYATKFTAYKQDVFIMHRGMLPLAIGWIVVVCLIIYAITKRKLLLKILLALSLTSFCVTLFALIIVNGLSYFVAKLYHVNFKVFLSYRSWRAVVLTSTAFLSLGRGFHILNGSFLSATSQSGSLSVAGVLLAFVLSLLLSTLTHLSLGIIRITAKMDDDYRFPFRHDRVHQIFCNVLQALGCIGFPHFFTAVYLLGCASLLVNNEICHLITIEKCLADLFPSLSRYRKYVYSITCLFCFLLSAILLSTSPLVRSAYGHLFAGFVNAIAFNAMTSTVVVFWIYGVRNVCDDIHFSSGAQPNRFWRICWYLAPVFTGLTFVSKIYDSDSSKYWSFALLVSPFFVTGVHEMFKFVRARNIVGLFRKDAMFGPPKEADRILRKFFNPRTEIRCKKQHDSCSHRCLNGSKVLQKLAQEEGQYENKAEPNLNA